jgi:hypothetical protein
MDGSWPVSRLRFDQVSGIGIAWGAENLRGVSTLDQTPFAQDENGGAIVGHGSGGMIRLRAA